MCLTDRSKTEQITCTATIAANYWQLHVEVSSTQRQDTRTTGLIKWPAQPGAENRLDTLYTVCRHTNQHKAGILACMHAAQHERLPPPISRDDAAPLPHLSAVDNRPVPVTAGSQVRPPAHKNTSQPESKYTSAGPPVSKTVHQKQKWTSIWEWMGQ